MDFIQNYKAARRVSTPLVAIRTFDAKSTLDQLRRSLGDKLKEQAFILWDTIHGMRGLTEQGQAELATLLNSAEPDASVPLVETLRMAELRATHNLTLFISNAHLQWPNEPAVLQGIWNLRDTFKANGNMLVLLCAPGAIIPTELTNDILVLDEPLPTVAEIESLIRDTYKYAKIGEVPEDVLAAATDALIGVPSFAAEQSTAMCLEITGKGAYPAKTGVLNIAELWKHKRDVISQTPGLSVYSGDDKMEDIGGIEQVKMFCRRVMEGKDAPKVIIFIDEIEKALAGNGTDMSGVKGEMLGSLLTWMQDKDVGGLIFLGLPGVSKSQLAKALGGTYGRPVINFDIAGMQAGIIGSSGTNLRTAQKTVDAISGGRALAIATCNNIEALPPELRRRFEEGIFFFDTPTVQERATIWDIYRKKFGIPEDEQNPADDGWTGAEIKGCCKKAYRLQLTLREAAQYIVPVTKSSAELITNLRASASGKYLSASKPGVYMANETTSVLAMPQDVPRGRVMRNDED